MRKLRLTGGSPASGGTGSAVLIRDRHLESGLLPAGPGGRSAFRKASKALTGGEIEDPAGGTQVSLRRDIRLLETT